jgi:hypothetical protein
MNAFIVDRGRGPQIAGTRNSAALTVRLLTEESRKGLGAHSDLYS